MTATGTGALRERLGQAVRAEWVRYCLETGDTKPSHIAPWEDLSAWDREADRRIGEAVLREAGLAAAGGTLTATPDIRAAVERMVDGIDTGEDRNVVRRWLGR